jgi:hypothetical protein
VWLQELDSLPAAERERPADPSPRQALCVATLLAHAALMTPWAASAQGLDAAPGFLPNVAIRGQGWSQLANPAELIEYGLGLVETFILAAAIAYHPTSLSARRTREDFEAPRILFVYALIGMVIGFLIMHHGYLIGFVVFGVGGLLRFKTDTNSSADTTRLILVTLIGLCVGLDLPIVGAVTTISAWVILYLLGRRTHYALEVRFQAKKAPENCVETLGERLAARGFRLVSVTKSRFKRAADYVLSAPVGLGRDALMREMEQIAAEERTGIDEWRVD